MTEPNIVTTSQSPSFELMPSDLPRLASEIAARLCSDIPAYARVTGTELEYELIQAETRNLELYLESLRRGRVPESEELTELEHIAGRRLDQGFPLDAVLRAGRLEAQVMWETVVVHAPPEILAELATLTMRYLDLLNSVSAQGYFKALEHVGSSREEAVRLFLGRVLAGAFTDEQEAAAEARPLGYELGVLRTGVVIEPLSAPGRSRSLADMELAEVMRSLRRRFPDAPLGLVDLGVVLAASASSADVVARIVGSVLADRDAGFLLTAGVGSPRVGARGLMTSLREARRARALGSVLAPQEPVHRYDELRLLDLFKEDGTVDGFVQDVLTPLLPPGGRSRRQLVETLQAFFEAGMVRKAAANRLGIHPNTLDYRLREAERVLGYGVRAGNASFRLQLALKLVPLTAEGDRAPD